MTCLNETLFNRQAAMREMRKLAATIGTKCRTTVDGLDVLDAPKILEEIVSTNQNGAKIVWQGSYLTIYDTGCIVNIRVPITPTYTHCSAHFEYTAVFGMELKNGTYELALLPLPWVLYAGNAEALKSIEATFCMLYALNKMRIKYGKEIIHCAGF